MARNREVLHILLLEFRKRYPQRAPGFGGGILQSALQTSNETLLDRFLDAKFDVNVFWNNEYGEETALVFVIRKYRGTRPDLVTKLLDAGGDTNVLASRPSGRRQNSKNYSGSNRQSQTAFLEAINTKGLPLVKLLIDKGADV